MVDRTLYEESKELRDLLDDIIQDVCEWEADAPVDSDKVMAFVHGYLECKKGSVYGWHRSWKERYNNGTN